MEARTTEQIGFGTYCDKKSFVNINDFFPVLFHRGRALRHSQTSEKERMKSVKTMKFSQASNRVCGIHKSFIPELIRFPQQNKRTGSLPLESSYCSWPEETEKRSIAKQ